MDTRLTLVIGTALLAGCHPKIDHVRPGNLSAGYNKSLHVSVKSRLARRIALSGQLTSGAATYEAHAIPGQALLLSGSHTISPGSEAVYRVVVTYSWPFSSKRRERIAEGILVVDDPARLHASSQVSCFAVGEYLVTSWRFDPIPNFDPVSVTAGELRIARTTTPAGSPQDGITVELLGVEVGREDFVLVTNRQHLVVNPLHLLVVPDATAPIDLASGSPSGNEVVPEPPEVDGWIGKAHALRWGAKYGAIEYAVEIYRQPEVLVDSFLANGQRSYAVAWLSDSGKYTWRLRARVPSCNGEPRWTEFSELQVVR
jgi:hypothetical protein